MDSNSYLPGLIPDPLSFALDAVPKVQVVVAKCPTNQPEPDAFIYILGSLLVDVHAHLDKIQDTEGSPSDTTKRKILLVLDALEVLVNWPNRPGSKPSPNEPFKPENYATLMKGLSTPNQQTRAKLNIRKLASGKDERVRSARLKFRKTFVNFTKQQKHTHSQTDRKDFSGKIARPPRGPPLAELLVSNVKSAGSDDYTDCLHLLHEKLYCSLYVKGHAGFYTANIGLTPEQRKGETGDEANDEVPFDCFFLHRHPNPLDDTGMWKQAEIRVFLQKEQAKSRVRWQVGTISSQQFCALLCRKTFERHVFSVGNDGLAFLSTGSLEPFFLLDAPIVPLAEVLEQRKLHGDDQRKLLLSYLLAKAVWQFYESAWMTPHWTKHAIHFMRQRLDFLSESQETLMSIHKPYFMTEMRSTSSNDLLPSEQTYQDAGLTQKFPPPNGHTHPKALALGILLLEIELGKGIEDYHQHRTRMENEDYVTAVRIIISDSWKNRGTYEALREIIEICISGETDKFGTDDTSAREGVHTYVVEPLRRLFKQAWSLDQEPELYEPHPVSFRQGELSSDNMNMHQLGTPARAIKSVDKGQSVKLTTSQYRNLRAHVEYIPGLVGGQSTAGADLSSDEDGGLCAVDDGGNTLECRQTGTNRWFKRFQQLLPKHGLLGRPSDRRFKVAILDSGIDASFFSREDWKRVKDTKSFISDDLGEDSSNEHHGTHIAAVILRLTKNVDLFIGKVTNSLKLSQREEIAQAIKFAREDWCVDMISLSFGYAQTQHPDRIKEEIDKCLSDSITVFASASNDGGRGPRTYPAEYERVLCAYSATHRGGKSDFNPLHGVRDVKYKFTFVGEHLRPLWGLPNLRDDHPMQYQSGTSYATPVAVCVAAFMLGYIDKNMPNISWGILPQSPEGIERIFRSVSFHSGDYHFVNPADCFAHTREGKIREDLMYYLGGKEKE